MPKIRISNKTLGLLIVIAAFFTASTYYKYTYAGCADIEDLDDRAKCYAEKIEDKKDEYESISNKLNTIRSKKDQISGAISNYLAELSVTQEQIDGLQADINSIKADLDVIEENLTDRKGKLASKIDFRNKIIRNYSKRSFVTDLEIFFSFNPFETGLNGFQYESFSYKLNKALSNNALEVIHLLSSEIENFEKDKQETEDIKNELEGTQGELLALKSDIDYKKSLAQNEVKQLADTEGDYKDELFDLSKEIDELSAKQQSILNQKYGTETGSVGQYEPTKVTTPNPPPDFKPAFAAFSYGAFTHYNGMSQFGAQGRAKSGQSWKEIIEHYYGYLKLEKGYDEPDKIRVKGKGLSCNNSEKNYDEEVDFDTYLKRIYEMPSGWDEDALKVQAVAARTYAIRIKNANGFIAPNQSNQVYKDCDNGPGWVAAVKDTKGYVLTKDGNPALTEYSSTAGGYLNQSGWDSSGQWPDGAYEKKAESPWFRKAWYIKDYNDTSNCGRAHPWLNAEEMADIVNAWRVWTKGSGSERDRISPVTTSCWGGNPYSLGDMREIAGKYGTSYKKVSKISADISNNGSTSKVKIVTDQGTVEIDGQTFKTVFNLRAPSYIAIRSRLFDFENKN